MTMEDSVIKLLSRNSQIRSSYRWVLGGDWNSLWRVNVPIRREICRGCILHFRGLGFMLVCLQLCCNECIAWMILQAKLLSCFGRLGQHAIIWCGMLNKWYWRRWTGLRVPIGCSGKRLHCYVLELVQRFKTEIAVPITHQGRKGWSKRQLPKKIPWILKGSPSGMP